MSENLSQKSALGAKTPGRSQRCNTSHALPNLVSREAGQADFLCKYLINMARPPGDVSNELFDTLAQWNAFLEHRKSHDLQVPPCP